MAKAPAFAKAFAGRWRIVEMDVWDNDVLDLADEAHLTFQGASDGEIAFVAVKGFLDVRYGSRDGAACAEFSWQGEDDATTSAVAAGSGSEPPVAPSAMSSSTRPTTRASSANAIEFFNALLVVDALPAPNIQVHGRVHECVGVEFRVLGKEIHYALAERVFVEVSFVLYELARQPPEKRLLGVRVVHAA